MNTNGTLKL